MDAALRRPPAGAPMSQMWLDHTSRNSRTWDAPRPEWDKAHRRWDAPRHKWDAVIRHPADTGMRGGRAQPKSAAASS
ncbi:hypothetical protein GCM10009806_05780 [Microbacterium flavum]